MIDCKLSYKRYLQYKGEKAAEAAKSLERDLSQHRRKLVAEVVTVPSFGKRRSMYRHIQEAFKR